MKVNRMIEAQWVGTTDRPISFKLNEEIKQLEKVYGEVKIIDWKVNQGVNIETIHAVVEYEDEEN